MYIEMSLSTRYVWLFMSIVCYMLHVQASLVLEQPVAPSTATYNFKYTGSIQVHLSLFDTYEYQSNYI